MSLIKSIAGNSALYATGTAIRGLASFLMLPIYTSHLSTSDYGSLELISIIIDLTTLLLGARIAVGIFKIHSDEEDPGAKKSVVSTALWLMVLLNTVAMSVVMLSHDGVAHLLGLNSDFGNALSVFSATLVFNAASEVFFSYLRIKEQALTYVVINLVKLLIQLSANIYFIVYLDMNYWGVVYGALIASVATFALLAVRQLPEIGLRFSKDKAIALIQYSYPIIFSSLAMYYITFGDRYFLQHHYSADEVGIYALAYKLGMIVFMLFVTPFMLYWTPKQFEIAKQPDSEKTIGKIFFYTATLTAAIAGGVILLTPDVLKIIAQPAYWPAAESVPWLAAAYVLLFLNDYIKLGVLVSGRTSHIAYSSFLTAAVITPLYYFLIPDQGAVGAAKATFFAFLVRLIYIGYISQRYYRINIYWPRMIVSLSTITAVIYSLSLLSYSPIMAILIKGSVAAICIGLMILSVAYIDLKAQPKFRPI